MSIAAMTAYSEPIVVRFNKAMTEVSEVQKGGPKAGDVETSEPKTLWQLVEEDTVGAELSRGGLKDKLNEIDHWEVPDF